MHFISKNIKIFLLFIILFFLPFSLKGQINTEFLRKNYSSYGLFNQISLSTDIDDGNSKDFTLSVGGRSDFVQNNYHTFLLVNFKYKEAKKKISSKKGFAHFRFIYIPKNLISPEIFLQKDFDHGIDLTDRNLCGTGLRLNIIKSETTDSLKFIDLDFGIGLMFENENYINPSERTNFFRSTNYLSITLKINQLINLICAAYFQPNISKINDFRFLCNSILEFKITKLLSFFTNFYYRFDNDPRLNYVKYDLELINGLSINF